VAVTDPLAPDCERTIGSLPVGAVESYACSLANVTADLTNSATASGEYEGVPVNATDTHFVDVIQPALAIDVTPDAQSIFSGWTAYFTVDISNTGDNDLQNVAVAAPDVPDCARLIGTLAAGGNTSYTCSQVNVLAGFTNSLTVSGDPPLGATIFASDSALVTVRTLEDPMDGTDLATIAAP